MKSSAKKKKRESKREGGINRITVAGYKSICHEQSIEIRPLTILAGANSSGKSSIMQPLLLLKQTLEATYDPGALLLNGSHVRFTSADQCLSCKEKAADNHSFSIGIGLSNGESLLTQFKAIPKKGFDVKKMIYCRDEEKLNLQPGMTHEEILKALSSSSFRELGSPPEPAKIIRLTVVRDRCFLNVEASLKVQKERWTAPLFPPGGRLGPYIRSLIHLPGLRGNPERTYPVTAVGPRYQGTFEKYAASVIAKWQADKSDKIQELGNDLERLGLTWKISSRWIDETQVELQVGRLPHAVRGGAFDQVSIADVGFGVSQTLPVLVALHAAKAGQLVYVEQPEIHLHPKAQVALAEVLADAAKRGVRVVAETHSALLLLAVQTLVAEKKLDPSLIKLHWFNRENGLTIITSADLDEAGAFGDWPEDFCDVELGAESRYLDAVETQQAKK